MLVHKKTPVKLNVKKLKGPSKKDIIAKCIELGIDYKSKAKREELQSAIDGAFGVAKMGSLSLDDDGPTPIV